MKTQYVTTEGRVYVLQGTREELVEAVQRHRDLYPIRPIEDFIDGKCSVKDYLPYFEAGIPYALKGGVFAPYQGGFASIPTAMRRAAFKSMWFADVPPRLQHLLWGLNYHGLRERVRRAQTSGWAKVLDIPVEGVSDEALPLYRCFSRDVAEAILRHPPVQLTVAVVGMSVEFSDGTSYNGARHGLRVAMRKKMLPAVVTHSRQSALYYKTGEMRIKLPASVESFWRRSEDPDVNAWLKRLRVSQIAEVASMEFTSWQSVCLRFKFKLDEQTLKARIGKGAWKAFLKLPFLDAWERVRAAKKPEDMRELVRMGHREVATSRRVGLKWGLWLKKWQLPQDLTVGAAGLYNTYGHDLLTLLLDTLQMASEQRLRLAPEQMTRKLLRKTHDELVEAVRLQKASPTPMYEPDMHEVDGVTFTRLLSPYHYAKEGEEMHHCVAQYVNRKASRIYSVRSCYGRSTLEMAGLVAVQHQGPYNRDVPPQHIAALEKLKGVINNAK